MAFHSLRNFYKYHFESKKSMNSLKSFVIPWKEYWPAFDELCAKLKKNNKLELVNELRKVQLYANGLTDGWFDFLQAFENAIKDKENILDNDEKKLVKSLIITLKQVLKKDKRMHKDIFPAQQDIHSLGL
jgi:hypothetical protein